MKKIYDSPALTVVTILHESLICDSVAVSKESVSNTSDIGFVKSDNTSRSGSSVWDEDWSK